MDQVGAEPFVVPGEMHERPPEGDVLAAPPLEAWVDPVDVEVSGAGEDDDPAAGDPSVERTVERAAWDVSGVPVLGALWLCEATYQTVWYHPLDFPYSDHTDRLVQGVRGDDAVGVGDDQHVSRSLSEGPVDSGAFRPGLPGVAGGDLPGWVVGGVVVEDVPPVGFPVGAVEVLERDQQRDRVSIHSGVNASHELASAHLEASAESSATVAGCVARSVMTAARASGSAS